jgi:hypothetical protein
VHFRTHLPDRGPDCKIWPYGVGSGGYGRVYLDGKVYRVHVLACADRWGPRPDPKLIAAHGPCHDVRCWNGDHLSWATRKQNTADMRRDGTAPIGSRHGRAKLTEAQVLTIRAAGADDRRQVSDLAKRFSVTPDTIRLVIRGRIWTHIL